MDLIFTYMFNLLDEVLDDSTFMDLERLRRASEIKMGLILLNLYFNSDKNVFLLSFAA